MLASMLGTIHNLRYYQRLTEGMRDALDNGTFDEFVQDFYARRGLEVPPCLSMNKRDLRSTSRQGKLQNELGLCQVSDSYF